MVQPDLRLLVGNDFKLSQCEPGEHRELCWTLEEGQPWDCAYITWGHAVVPLFVLGSQEKEFPCNFQSVNHQDAVVLLTFERITFIPCFVSLLQSKLVIKCLVLGS